MCKIKLIFSELYTNNVLPPFFYVKRMKFSSYFRNIRRTNTAPAQASQPLHANGKIGSQPLREQRKKRQFPFLHVCMQGTSSCSLVDKHRVKTITDCVNFHAKVYTPYKEKRREYDNMKTISICMQMESMKGRKSSTCVDYQPR